MVVVVGQGAQMLAEDVFLGFGMAVLLLSVSRWAISRARVVVAALVGFVAAWIGFVVVAAIDGLDVWDLVLGALFAVLGPLAWDVGRVRAGGKSVIVSRVFYLPGRMAYRLGGQRGLERYLRWALPVPAADLRHTIEQIRVEYAATALDNARSDPNLDGVIDGLADHLADTLRPVAQTWQYQGSAEASYSILTVFANQIIDGVSEPGHSAGAGYGGYSAFVLTMAAVCRLADRISPPSRERGQLARPDLSG
jgi:hypothetical protein